MARLLKFLIALKLNFNGGQLVILKSGKNHMKIVKFEVINFEHLRCRVINVYFMIT